MLGPGTLVVKHMRTIRPTTPADAAIDPLLAGAEERRVLAPTLVRGSA